MNIQLAVSNRWSNRWVEGIWQNAMSFSFSKKRQPEIIKHKSSNSEIQIITVYFSLIIPELVVKSFIVTQVSLSSRETRFKIQLIQFTKMSGGPHSCLINKA